MALSNAQLDAVARDVLVSKKVADNYFNSNPILFKLKSAGKVLDGGNQLKQLVKYDYNHASGVFDPRASYSTNPNDFMKPAYFDWGYQRSTVTLFEVDMNMSSGAEQLADYMGESVINGRETLEHNLGTSIQSDGTTAYDLDGLRNIISTSTTCGSLTVAANAWWVASIVDATSHASFSSSALRKNIGKCIHGSKRPDLIVTTQIVYDYIRDYYESAKLAVDRDMNLYNAGFENVKFENIPIVVDSHQTAGYLQILNIKDGMKLCYHKNATGTLGKFQNMEVAGLWARTATQYFQGNLVVQERRLFGSMTGMPTT